jgi:hypothetical protein
MSFLIIGICILAVGAIRFLWRRDRAADLRSRFGSDYDRVIEIGAQRHTEAEKQRLKELNERSQQHALTRLQRERFAMEWQIEQDRFVTDPHGALARADVLISEVMRVHGYPTGAFEDRDDDDQDEESYVVDHYRTAHAIVVRDRYWKVSPEELRFAMQNYSQLFAEMTSAKHAAEAKQGGLVTMLTSALGKNEERKERKESVYDGQKMRASSM